jgi:hypothetical protein
MATKLELTQLLNTRNTELEAARLRISVLEGELALRPRPAKQETTQRLHSLAQQRSATRVLPANFAAAKYLAMTTGACVKVQP